ncbi:DUF7124 domain-containing protein [Candidatus Halobonum tyrrellensis]|uniref:DUF7124 domain-containing protein n=1 Tax=Candidatus Halobonum tyrrellensis G22 TaxID=1324957 RepID=V4HHD4_9EURY|nr:hypothetical protein [Candidatus Halobonum tyrrellensis]ESP90175.1 hypothetical protein K933_01402 [Candidatus Halobonum tyrrellensis G22]
MGVTTDGEEGGRLTLAFTFAAFEEFARPGAVLADAREWSRYVGVVGNDTEAVRAFLRARDLRHDFELGDRDKWLALRELRAETDTPRHVLVGTSRDDRMAAEGTGWEFVPVGEAAEKAGWERGDGTDESAGLASRLRALFGRR